MKLIEDFYILISRGTGSMHRCFSSITALVTLTVMSFPACAETPADAVGAANQSGHESPIANEAGFYVGLPSTDYQQLTGQIRLHLASLAQREVEVRKYLQEHQLDATDALITVIMPGGLLYAAMRKGDIERAKVKLAEITDDRDEFSRDLLAMQDEARQVTVARLD